MPYGQAASFSVICLVQAGLIALFPGIALKNLQAAPSPKSFQRNHGIETCSSATKGGGESTAPTADHQ